MTASFFLYAFLTGSLVESALRWRRLTRCTDCEPWCPNGHREEIKCVVLVFWVVFGALAGTIVGGLL